MKKFLLISNIAKGMILFRAQFIQKLIALNFKVVVICLNEDQNSITALQSLGCVVDIITFDRCSKNPFKDAIYAYTLWKKIKNHQPDFVINYTIKPAIYGSIAARYAGIKNVYSMIPGLGNTFIIKNLTDQFIQMIVISLYRFALKSNQKVFFLNPDDQAEFFKYRIVRREQQICLSGEGVSLEDYPFALPTTEPVNFLLIARLIPDKGIVEFMRAAEKIKLKYPQVNFTLVGPFDLNHSNAITSETISQYSKVVDYKGAVDDVRLYLQECSVFVLPSSYREGIPRSILEAMAFGRPIITTDAPGCRETVIEGKNGFLIPVKNVDALVEKMEIFIHNPALIETLGLKSRRLAEEKFNVHRVNQTILSTILIENL